MPKTLMLLEGGAYRGIFTAGALDVLLEHDFYFDAVAGISAGAMCGYHFIGKLHERRMEQHYGIRPACDGKARNDMHRIAGTGLPQLRYLASGNQFPHAPIYASGGHDGEDRAIDCLILARVR